MRKIILWLAKVFGVSFVDPVLAQANKAIEELTEENDRLRGAVKTVIIKPPSDTEFKSYCAGLDGDIMFRYLLFSIIDKYYRDLINNHKPELHDMYRGRLLGIEELKKQVHDNAYTADVQNQIESILGAMS